MKTVGLSMIVKNEAHTLRPCLESVRGLVSQIVVGDTGSTDNTVEIAKEMGATVVSVPWTNHYAEARNAALAPVKTDWVLVLDADEELDPEAKQLIPKLIEDSDVSGGYMCRIRQYMKQKTARFMDRIATENDFRHARSKESPSFHIQNTIRLFRRSPDIYFFGRIHELVEYRISLLKLKIAYCDVIIHHFGQLEDEGQRVEKHKYYRELGRLKVKDEPDNPFAWFELGLLEYSNFHDTDAAIRCFEKSVKVHADFPRAWQYIADIRLKKGDNEGALQAVQRITSSAGMVGEVERLRGDIFYNLGKFEEARAAYNLALKDSPGDPLLESRAGFIDVRLGNVQQGVERIQHAIDREPHMVEPHDRLVKALILADNLPAAAEAAERFASCIMQPKTILRAASIRAQLNQWQRAVQILKVGLRFFPDAPELKKACDTMEQNTTAAGV